MGLSVSLLVDRVQEGDIHQLFNNRNNSLDLFIFGDSIASRPGALSSNVDDVDAVLDHLQSVLQSALEMRTERITYRQIVVLASITEGVWSHVQDAHDEGVLTPVVDVLAIEGGHGTHV